MRPTFVRRLVPLLVAAGCTDPATQLVVAVDTDYLVPAELAHVEAYTKRVIGGGESVRLERDLAAAGDMPFSFGVAPKEDEIDLEIDVIVEGYAQSSDASPLVVARARSGFIEEKSLHLPIFLAKGCSDVWSTCEEDQTCIGGTCETSARPPEGLNPYDPDIELDVPRPDAGTGGPDGGGPDGGQPDGGGGCTLALGAPADLGSASIAFDPNLDLLAADLDGDGVSEFVAARHDSAGSPIAILDFDDCDTPVVTATAAYGDLRQGLLWADALYSVERRKISRWDYDGPNMIAQRDVPVVVGDDIERLEFGPNPSAGFAVINIDGSGWSYASVDPSSGITASTPAPQRPKGFSAYFGQGVHLHADDLALRRINPGSSISSIVSSSQVRDPIVVGASDEVLVAARANERDLLIAVWKEGNFTNTATVTFGASIIAGPVAATSLEDTRFYVLLADGTLTGCETHEDNGQCPILSSSRQLSLDDIDDDRALLTAWIDQDDWPDIVLVSRRGRVYFASGAAPGSDAAPMVDLGQDARHASALVPDFFSAFGSSGTLLVVQHDGKLSLVGWRGSAGPADRLWPQHRQNAGRSARLD